jgi:uncharacterized protein (TIGR00255 family)
MIRSMTAFGRRQATGDWGTLTWELRSVNHRYLETVVRMPEDLRGLETAVRERVARRLRRGKVECGLRYQPPAAGAQAIRLDAERVRTLIAAAEQVAGLVDKPGKIDPIDVLRWPGVVEESEREIDPIQKEALALLDATLEDLIKTREDEGARIRSLIVERCESITAIVARVRERRPQLLAELREKYLERIRERLSDLGAEADQGRLEQELAIAAQRLDVDEELDRLASHVAEINQVLSRSEPVGRRLDFLMQELNREANTLGSKSADLETTQHAVELKVLIEQMREQVQNVE